MATLSRRGFIKNSVAGGLALSYANDVRALDSAPNRRLRLGLMGAGGRGKDLGISFQRHADVEVRFVCDPDQQRAASLAKTLVEEGSKHVEPIADFRHILDDDAIDALVIAAPNHWHGPATILACDAGKHVYVEKPCSHNPREGELMIAAAKRNNRCVQIGLQRRSDAGFHEAIAKLHMGKIGRVYFARTYYSNVRPSIGQGQRSSPPNHLDFELWQGPAPRQPYRSNLLHYNWHWFWDYGNGEGGNNGVHYIDIARWGLKANYPIRVSSIGGRFHFKDDQQTPDTNVVTLEYDNGCMIRWECSSCVRYDSDDIVFHGTEGTLAMRGSEYRIQRLDGEIVERGSLSAPTDDHVANFITAVREDSPSSLAVGIEEGHKSTLATELANISYRVGRTLNCESDQGHIVGDDEAMQMWGREYAAGWKPRES